MIINILLLVRSSTPFKDYDFMESLLQVLIIGVDNVEEDHKKDHQSDCYSENILELEE